MKKVFASFFGSLWAVLSGERVAKAYMGGLLMAYFSIMLTNPANAQDLRSTGIGIFTVVYGAVGVIAALVLLFHAINWKFGGILGGSGDPKKSFIQAGIATAFAFGVVAFVQFIKGVVSSGANIGSL